MIIFDMSQIVISNVTVEYKDNPQDINEDVIRHLVLSYILKYVKQFRGTYGTDVVIATDNKNYWRKRSFPPYKAHRAKQRQVSKYDWKLIFDSVNNLKNEFYGNLPYKIIDVDGAEADDIIAILSKHSSKSLNEKTLIISSDMDFIQLQKYSGVDQFVPKKKSFLKVDDPVLYLREHIIRGDKDDGIPNILSKDDVFISGGRQKPIMTAKLQEWVKCFKIEDFCTTEEMVRNYHRNTSLIDLDKIPSDIEASIMDRYQNCAIGNKKKMMDYFYDKGAVNLIQFIGDF
jgi:hypothetical protein